MNTFDGTFSDESDWSEPIQFGGPEQESNEGSTIKKPRVTPEFAFARWLQGRDYGKADECEPLVRLHCEMNDLPFDEFWIEFEHCWEDVQFPDNGRDNFAEAVEKMDRQPIEWPCAGKPPTRFHHRIASLAFYLNQYTNGNPFLLPRKKLSETFKISKPRISRIRARLERLGIIVCVQQGTPPCSASKYILGSQLLKPIPLPKRTEENPRVSKKPEDLGSRVSLKQPVQGRLPIQTGFDVPF